jgi:hypothetical protein
MTQPWLPTEVNVDLRAAFLGRAAARDALFQADVIDLDQAFHELVEPFLDIVFPRPRSDAEAYWNAPGWHEAAIEYHNNRRIGGSRR